MIAVGLAAALFAFWATQQYAREQVSAERERLLPRGGFVEVLVAARGLEAGERISPETIAIRQIPGDWMLPTSLRPHDFDSVNQALLARTLEAGHPLTLDHLRQSKAMQSGVVLEAGTRAISIAVDEVSSVGGLIQPGDRVDLWGTALTLGGAETGPLVPLQSDDARGARPAKLVAENLRVIATGQQTERLDKDHQAERGAYSSITLAVPTRVAAAVLGGQFQGRLGIALRSPADTTPLRTKRNVASKPRELPVEILIGGIDGGLQ
jgi:pilus assembly protein CpaB